MAFHDYQGDVSKMLSRAQGLKQRYGKPCWITEFAINKWARMQGGRCENCNITRSMQDAYMKQVLSALDSSDAVFRYGSGSTQFNWHRACLPACLPACLRVCLRVCLPV